MGESQDRGREYRPNARSEVCTHDRGQDSPIQTDLARLIRYLLYGKEENLKSFRLQIERSDFEPWNRKTCTFNHIIHPYLPR